MFFLPPQVIMKRSLANCFDDRREAKDLPQSPEEKNI